jgi:quercetin dioxygenase-like cupin family protein
MALIAAYPFLKLSKINSIFMFKENKGFKVSAGEDRFGEHKKMKGITSNVLDTKISSKDTNGELTVFEQTGTAAKGGPPLHIHPNQDEMFYILEGEYIYQVSDERFQMSAGDTIFLPRNVPHAFVQLTDKAKVIVTFQPSGKMEEFFMKTSLWTSPPSNEEIVKLFEEHDMKVVGPPLKAE